MGARDLGPPPPKAWPHRIIEVGRPGRHPPVLPGGGYAWFGAEKHGGAERDCNTYDEVTE